MIDKGHVIAFALGAVSLYAVARIASPYIRNRIASGVTDKIVGMQNSSIGFTPISRPIAYTEIGVPIAQQTLESMYLA